MDKIWAYCLTYMYAKRLIAQTSEVQLLINYYVTQRSNTDQLPPITSNGQILINYSIKIDCRSINFHNLKSPVSVRPVSMQQR